MAEELKYKVVLDAEDVPAYLSALKQQIDSVMESSGRGFGGPSFGAIPSDMQFATPRVRSVIEDLALPSQNFSPVSGYSAQIPELQSVASYSSQVPSLAAANYYTLPEFMPMTADPISMAIPSFEQGKDALTRASELIQTGYYKATTGLESIRSTAELARYNLVKGFDRRVTSVGQMSPIQLGLGTALGLGYDPLESTLSRQEWSLEAWQRLADNKTLGMADWSFSDLALDSAIAGASIGGFLGIKGAVVGALAGTVVGSAAYLANEVVRPFREEDTFRRNITRGLRNYSRYTPAGAMSFEDRAEVADFVAERDLSSDLVGKGIGRADIEGMFNQLLQTDYFQQSINSEDMINKIRDFTKNFTDVMHIFRVSREEVGKIVDQLNNAGIIDMFGSIGTASKFVEAAGISARLDPNQALQMYQTGAEMLRGTGVAMGAGGDLLVSTLADIKNLLQVGSINNETIRQLGGTEQAALSLSHQFYRQASSPGGFLLGQAMRQGTYDPEAGLGQNYLAGLAGIGNYEDFLQGSIDQLNYMSEPGNIAKLGISQTIGRLTRLSETGLIRDLTPDKAAMYLSQTTGVSFPEAQLQVEAAMNAGDSAFKQYNEAVETVARRIYQDKPSWFAETTDNISNWITGAWRDIFQIRGDYNTEVSMEVPEFIKSGIMGTAMRSNVVDMIPERLTTESESLRDLSVSGQKAWDNIYGSVVKSRGGSWYGKQADYLTGSGGAKDFFTSNRTVRISPGDVEQFIESEFNVTFVGTEADNFYAELYEDYLKTNVGSIPELKKLTEFSLQFNIQGLDLSGLQKEFNLTKDEIEVVQAEEYGNLTYSQATIKAYEDIKLLEEERKTLKPSVPEEKKRREEINREIAVKQSALFEKKKEEASDVAVIETFNFSKVEDMVSNLEELAKGFTDNSMLGTVSDASLVIKKLQDDSWFWGFGEKFTTGDILTFGDTMRDDKKRKEYLASLSPGDARIASEFWEKHKKDVEKVESAIYTKDRFSMDTLEKSNEVFQEYATSLKKDMQSRLLEFFEVDDIGDIKLEDNPKKFAGYLAKYPEERKKIYKRVEAEDGDAALLGQLALLGTTAQDKMMLTGKLGAEEERVLLQQKYEQAEQLLQLSTQMKTIMNSDGTVTQTRQVDPVMAAMNSNTVQTNRLLERNNSIASAMLYYMAKNSGGIDSLKNVDINAVETFVNNLPVAAR